MRHNREENKKDVTAIFTSGKISYRITPKSDLQKKKKHDKKKILSVLP